MEAWGKCRAAWMSNITRLVLSILACLKNSEFCHSGFRAPLWKDKWIRLTKVHMFSTRTENCKLDKHFFVFNNVFIYYMTNVKRMELTLIQRFSPRRPYRKWNYSNSRLSSSNTDDKIITTTDQHFESSFIKKILTFYTMDWSDVKDNRFSDT